MSASTFRALLLLLYGTGMRIGEALRLRGGDVDLGNGIITVRGTKFYKSRLVPLGADVHAHLRVYLALPGLEEWIATINRSSNPGYTRRFHAMWLKSASGSCAISRAFAGIAPARINRVFTICGIPSRSTD